MRTPLFIIALLMMVSAACAGSEEANSPARRSGPSAEGAAPSPTPTPSAVLSLPPAPPPRPVAPPVSPQPVTALVDPREGGLEVGLAEWAIGLEADAIRPGPVTFRIRNSGTHTHAFEIEPSEEGFEIETELIPPGGEAELTLDLRSGTYKVKCPIEEPGVGEHDELGMEGVLTVREDAPLSAVQMNPPPPGGAPPAAASIQAFAFSPAVIQVAAGSSVTWANQDPAPHTVTAEDGSFDSGMMGTGATFSWTFSAPGVFSYRCNIHPNMKGQVQVTP